MTPSPLTREQKTLFHKLLEDNRDTALVFLSAQMNDLFGSTDEALLDFAEQAENNALRGRFYEAMGFINKYRSQLEQLYREAIHEGFDQFGRNKPDDSEFTSDIGEEMSLVGRDEMEESVAADNLIIRTRDSYYTELYALSQRLAVVNGGHKVLDEDIPTGPPHMVNAFKQSIADINIDVKAKIVLYALYEKFVLTQLKGLYDEQNDNLKQAGILPNLRPSISKGSYRKTPHVSHPEVPQPDTSDANETDLSNTEIPQRFSSTTHAEAAQTRSGPTAPGTSAKGELGRELFDSILNLMAVKRGGATVHSQTYAGTDNSTGGYSGMPSASGLSGGSAGPDSGIAHDSMSRFPAGEGPSGGSGHAVSSSLISAIDSVRPTSLGQGKGVLANLDALPQIAVDPQFLDKLKGVLHQERQEILAVVDQDDIQGVDADTIDLVGMLFEYMLNAPLLPNVAKALLSHLHTPYLKLALTDRKLLVDSEHPARLLLDLLVEAGGQWVFENDIKRGIFPHMQRVVDRVLQEFSDNAGLFPELVTDFSASMDEQRRKTDAVETRARESVNGREKLQIAKMRSAKEMQARAQMTPMPKSACRFLTQAWSDRLVFILLRHDDGELCDEWIQALQIADDLVWLFDPFSADAGDAEIRNTGRRIHEAVESALDTLGGYHQHYLHELYGFLDDPDTIATWRSDQELSDMVDSALADPDYMAEHGAEAQAKAQPADAPVQATDTAQANLEPGADLSQEQRDMLNKLKKLKFGTWFEFGQGERKIRRLKLSWLSPLTSTCMFVDKSGVQVKVNALEEVAQMLAAGQAKIIPKPKYRFVEGALLAIKNTLQRSMEATD